MWVGQIRPAATANSSYGSAAAPSHPGARTRGTQAPPAQSHALFVAAGGGELRSQHARVCAVARCIAMGPGRRWSCRILSRKAVDDGDLSVEMGPKLAEVVPAGARVDTPRQTIMRMVWMRPVLRLLLLVVLLLLTGPLRACESLAPPANSPDVGRRPPGLTEVYPYTDGIEVQVSDVWSGRRLGVPVIELTVTVWNGSAHTFEAWIRGNLRYGPYRLPAVRYLTQPGPDDSGSVQLIAIGEHSDPYRLSFVLPPRSRDDVVFDLAIDADTHDPAVFVGGL